MVATTPAQPLSINKTDLTQKLTGVGDEELRGMLAHAHAA